MLRKTSSGSHFGISFIPVAKVQFSLSGLQDPFFLLVYCSSAMITGPSTKITCLRCLKTVRRNQPFGICILGKSRSHLRCLDANFESGSTCQFCSVPFYAEQLALYSWGHMTKFFVENFYFMGYNLKNARNGKSASKIKKNKKI